MSHGKNFFKVWIQEKLKGMKYSQMWKFIKLKFISKALNVKIFFFEKIEILKEIVKLNMIIYKKIRVEIFQIENFLLYRLKMFKKLSLV